MGRLVLNWVCVLALVALPAGGCSEKTAATGGTGGDGGSAGMGGGGSRPGPDECPTVGDLDTAPELLPELLPTADTLWEWETFMVGLGIRLPANPALAQWHDFLVSELEDLGLDVVRDPVMVGEWVDHADWSLALVQGDVETDVPVASYYPYSGSTPDGGIVAELADAGLGGQDAFDAGDFASKIALVEQPRVSTLVTGDRATYMHDPDESIDLPLSYERASLSYRVPQTNSPLRAKAAGAAGVIIALDYSADNAAGQYTPFLDSPKGIPTLYVDRDTGAMLRERAADGASARLDLVVNVHESGMTEDIIATLSGGSSDEVIIVNTHTDGTSASEENGGIAILAMAQYLTSLPDDCLARTFVFVLTPGHFYYGLQDTLRFISRHPEIMKKAVASLTAEHLGQMEWLDDDTGFHATGLPEIATLTGSDTPIQTIGKSAVIAEDLRRTLVWRPRAIGTYGGVGSALHHAGVPNLTYLVAPNSMLSWGVRTGENVYSQNLDKTDRNRMHQEVRTLTRIAVALDSTPAEVLCEGMCLER